WATAQASRSRGGRTSTLRPLNTAAPVSSSSTATGRDYSITRLPDYSITRLLDYSITRLPDYPITRLPDYPITRLPDYPITRLPLSAPHLTSTAFFLSRASPAATPSGGPPDPGCRARAAPP